MSARDDLEAIITENSNILHIDAKVYLNILKASLSESYKDIARLDEAIASRQYSLIHSIAHRLKGVYGNLRFDVLHEVSENIDVLAKENGSIEEIYQQYLILKEALDKLDRDLQSLEDI